MSSHDYPSYVGTGYPRLPADEATEQAGQRRDIEILKRKAPPGQAVVYPLKVFADWQNVRTGNGRFVFWPDEDVDGYVLTKVEIAVSTVSSSGIVQVQIRRGASTDVLSTRIQIDASENHSETAATAYVINAASATVSWPEPWSIDVDLAGTNARGLEVHLTFSP